MMVLTPVINVIMTGMTILVFYHPNFLIFNAFLLGGFLLVAVAAEVIVGALLLNLDTVTRRIYAMTYVMTSLDELSRVFALLKHDAFGIESTTTLPDLSVCGVQLTCKETAFAYPHAPPLFSHFNLEAAPGEKLAVLVPSSAEKSALALILGGLYRPTSGVVRYNDVDLRDVSLDYVNAARGLVLDSQPTLFGGTIEENIALGRASIPFHDVRWALRFVELEEDVDRMPRALETQVESGGNRYTKSQILRLLVARAVVTRPPLLIFDGTLHNMEPSLRQILLRRLCSKEEAWSVIFVTNDPSIKDHVDRCIVLD